MEGFKFESFRLGFQRAMVEKSLSEAEGFVTTLAYISEMEPYQVALLVEDARRSLQYKKSHVKSFQDEAERIANGDNRIENQL